MSKEDSTKKIRVMLVEDHAAFRRAMALLLSREPDLDVVAEAGSLDEARRHAALVEFDVAVMDLGLPDGDGADGIADLRRYNPGVTVLILSASLDPSNLARVKEAGADGMVDKFATPGEIVGAIRRLRSEQA